MTKKQRITIHIADVGPLEIFLEPGEEENARKTAKEVNKLWTAWCNKFKTKSSNVILAMVAYRFAEVYFSLLSKINASEEALTEAEKALDKILLDVK